MKEWQKRLRRVQDAAESDATVLHLDDGTRAILPRAASLTMMFRIGGIDPSPDPDPWIDLFARSRPQGGEGQMTRFVRYWCRVRLGMPVDHLPPPELIFGGERWAAGHDVHAEVENYIEEQEATR